MTMSRVFRRLSLVLLLADGSAAMAAPDGDALAADYTQCGALRNTAVRRACYDAVTQQLETREGSSWARRARECGGRTGAGERLRCHDASARDAAVPPRDAAADLGAEQVARQTARNPENDDNENGAEDRKDYLESRVLKVDADPAGRRIFYLENGQVWKQNEPRYVQISPRNRPLARIEKASFGGYQLRIGGDGPMTRVTRLE